MDRTELTRIIASLTDEEFIKIAEEARGEPSNGTHVPGVGNQPSLGPSDERSQIAIAQQAGDWQRAVELKTQMLLQPHRQS